jgi:hypothetical protein
MTNVLDRLPSGARVAIIRLRSLGDCVLTTPALALLKQARPDLKLSGGGGRPLRGSVRRQSGCRSNPRPNAASLARFRPHLALNLHGGATSVRMMLAAASGLRAGFGSFSLPAHVQHAHPARAGDSGAWTARSTRRNISHPPCFIWECRNRDPARAIVCRALSRPASLRRPASVRVGARQDLARRKTSWPLRGIWMRPGDRTAVYREAPDEDLSAFGEYPAFKARRSKK